MSTASKVIMEPSGYVCLESYQFTEEPENIIYYKKIDFNYFFEQVLNNEEAWETFPEFDVKNPLKRNESIYNICNILIFYNIWYYRGKYAMQGFSDTTMIRQLAYMLATSRNETASLYEPVRETQGVVSGGFGSKASFSYLSKMVGTYKNDDDWVLLRDYEEGKEYKIPIYYGRGLSQVTHRYNYEKMKELIEWYIEKEKSARAVYDKDIPIEGTWEFTSVNSDVVSNPDNILHWSFSIVALFDGLLGGLYTGRPLTRYINNDTKNYYDARLSISSKDSATERVAQWAEIFEQGLRMKDYIYASEEHSSYFSDLNSMIYS